MIEVDPMQTKRAAALQLWMEAPMPMVTIFKTLNVSRLVRYSKRTGLKFNMLLCWCVGRAASGMEEFYLLPVGKKLMKYDRLAVNTIVMNKTGEVSSCDVPFSPELAAFGRSYRDLTRQVSETCENHDLPDHMVIGTSALVPYEIDGVVNLYSGIFNNPFLHWGSYRRKGLRTVLPVSFQFHHTQMDGAHACRFLDALQAEINALGRT